MTSRLDAIRARFESSEIDGILIGSDENRRYVSGFSGTAGNLIITADAAVLATDFRYIEQAGQQAQDFRVLRVSGGGSDWLTNLLKELGVRRLGFESQHMTVATHERLSKGAGRGRQRRRRQPRADGRAGRRTALREGRGRDGVATTSHRHLGQGVRGGIENAQGRDDGA